MLDWLRNDLYVVPFALQYGNLLTNKLYNIEAKKIGLNVHVMLHYKKVTVRDILSMKRALKFEKNYLLTRHTGSTYCIEFLVPSKYTNTVNYILNSDIKSFNSTKILNVEFLIHKKAPIAK